MSEVHGLIGPNSRNAWRVDGGVVTLARPHRAPHPVTVEALPQSVTTDLAATALIVVDMQNDFCSPDGWLASIGVDVTPARAPIPVIADLLPLLRAADVPVIWLNWGNRPDRANLPPGVLHVYDPDGTGGGIGAPLPGGRVLEQGSPSAAIVEGLEPADGDLHVAKYRMSGFQDTELDSVLRNLRVDTLLFAGVNADQCVLATLMDAANLGYDILLLEDAVATTSPAYCMDATLYNVRQCFGFTLTSHALQEALK
ncbi:cysteine hydrolase family protein [Streptomyces griseorubiginosus]|uniref:cysteine hydrolase family protein n=1 Tax=Streptomyces griseorubiginosus TaxID=67304 RepID=UPI001AD6A708|nr:isochorismatase family cysteine hydrolase [Streptomyces griseorubiginosus]MBO4254072.1 isochorismatase family protein [Streptomyces griseorubiginosus]